MKKRFLLILLLLIPFSVKAEESLTYDEAVSAVKETIQAWYMRGAYRQYNSSKNTYSTRHPEDATSQDIGYSVCSGFTHDVWGEAFGIKAQDDDIPGGNSPVGANAYCVEAGAYLKNKGCKSNSIETGCNGEFVVYYSSNIDKKNYYYNPEGLSEKNISKFDNFIKLLQPGDVLAYNGHVAIVYDFKYEGGKKKDVLLFESTKGGKKVLSKIEPELNEDNKPTSNHLLYYYRKKNDNKNGLLDLTTDGSYMPYEGTVQWRWLYDYKYFVDPDTKKIRCKDNLDNCSITRAFYKGANGYAIFNYNVSEQNQDQNQIKTSKVRNELPGIYIQKTSSKYDNNSVLLGDTITYTIRIRNNSNMVKVKGLNQQKKYATFYVKEKLPEEVKFISSTIEGTQEGNYNENNHTITWKISSLESGKNIILKYKVYIRKDTTNLGKFIEAKGKVYTDTNKEDYYIPTSTVRHEIIHMASATDEDYSRCYKTYKDEKTSLNLIQKVYECVYENKSDLEFDLTDYPKKLKDLITVYPTKEGERTNKNTKVTLSKDKIYTDMILNNYWNVLVKNSSSNYYLPMWRKESTNSYMGGFDRAKTIVSGHFKTGDVLIYYVDKKNTPESLRYTNEDGLYAYIYIDEKFVGVNGSKNNKNIRNSFTVDYYGNPKVNLYEGEEDYYDYANYQTLFGKDYYVILRPSKVITEKSNTSKKNTSKSNSQNTNDQKTDGWKKKNGKWYYYGTDGVKKTGWQKINNKWYYLGTNGVMQTEWQKIKDKWYYLGSNGVMRTGWQKINWKKKDCWFYFGTNGVMQTGWQKINNKWYYLGTNGVMRTGWQKRKDKLYYLGSDGVMRTGWEKINDKWYYLGSNGVMRTGWQKIKWENKDCTFYFNNDGVMQTKWQKIDKKYYYLGTDGVMTTGWQQIDDKWYYLGTDGIMMTGWQKIGNKLYYLGTNGVMRTGWQQLDDKLYYFGTDGVMQTGWQNADNKWYYSDTNGVMQIKSGWQKINDKWYYLGANGVMQTGWQKIDNKLYYLGTDGVMQTGWQKIDNKWYYLGTDGVMQTGWQTINNKLYYLGTDGVMQKSWQKIDNKWYNLGTDGVMQTGWQKLEWEGNTNWYYFGTDGIMQTGWQKINSKWYYLGTNGAMQTGWQKLEWEGKNRWFYFNNDGVMQTGWQKLEWEGKVNWYYFESNGVMVRDTCMTINGSEFCFKKGGQCYSGKGC